jgi:hypothetical protein
MSARDDEAGPPPWRPPPFGRLNQLGVDAAACDHPRDHRVRIPHLTSAELITTPDGRRDARNLVEHAPSALLLAGEPPRAVDGLGDVRDVAAAPEPDLVAEDPKAPRPASADGALGDDAALLAAPVVNRRLLDHERSLRNFDLKRGVVEVARWPPLQPRRKRLVEATVEPDEVPARAEGQPVQVNGRHRRQRTLPSKVADFEFADAFLPIYDVSDAVATVAEADRETAWRALLDVDLLKLGRETPVVGMLGALRMLPEVVGHLLHGERPPKPPQSMRLRDLPSIPMYEGGWILLGERPGTEIALGLVGKFWRPVIEFARITSADEFREFDETGYAKTVYDLSVREVGANRTLLSGLMRTATTDEHARRWFRRYWTFGVGSGAHILVSALVDSARRAAEGDRDP